MPIVWTSPARRDINAHCDYLAERNPDAAERVEAVILRAVETLADFPHRGRPGRVDRTRELVISALPYIVVYHVGETRITILRVLHAAQRWPPLSNQAQD